jgi:dipeptidyl-peptidase 4
MIASMTVSGSPAAELTIDRLFDAPSLAGPTVTQIKLWRDGSRVTYLQGKQEDKDRLDLWEYDIGAGRSRRLVDSNLLAQSATRLSDEELARRERQRTAALSGILEYSVAPSGQALLIPIGGKLFQFDLGKAPAEAVTAVMPASGVVTDAGYSPCGGYLSYIRDQNLMIYDIAHAAERPITADGGGAIKNGMAEFVAQEEWAAVPVIGGPPMIGTLRSRASTRAPSNSRSGSRLRQTTSRRRSSSAIRPREGPTSRCGSASPT